MDSSPVEGACNLKVRDSHRTNKRRPNCSLYGSTEISGVGELLAFIT
jgi:hypothetical protein